MIYLRMMNKNYLIELDETERLQKRLETSAVNQLAWQKGLMVQK